MRCRERQRRRQVVVSGRAAVERAVALAQDEGAKRAVMLSVSAPFHCLLMAPAAEAMREALATAILNPPSFRSSRTWRHGPSRARCDLQRPGAPGHGTVRWRESVAYMAAEGVQSFYEAGQARS